MNRLELIKLLSSSDEEEVYLEDPETELLYDIEIKHIEEQFDGFVGLTDASGEILFIFD